MNSSKSPRYLELRSSAPKEAGDFVTELRSHAKGVFLWVYYAVRNPLQGLSKKDNIAILQERLREFLKELRGKSNFPKLLCFASPRQLSKDRSRGTHLRCILLVGGDSLVICRLQWTSALESVGLTSELKKGASITRGPFGRSGP